MAKSEVIENINPKRIVWCCAEIDLSMEDFAVEIKISLDKIESGNLTFNQLQKIADYFGYDVLFYLHPGEPEAEIHSVQFRTLKNQQIKFDHRLSKLVRQIEEHRDLYLGLLESLGETHTFTAPDLNSTIKEKANAVRQWLNLVPNQTYDYKKYRDIIQHKGIMIFQGVGYSGAWKVHDNKLEGFCMAYDDAPVIFINTKGGDARVSDKRMTFTLFHELGHILLHKKSCMDDENTLTPKTSSKEERAANEFAGLSLLPDEMLNTVSDLISGNFKNYYDDFIDLSNQWGISVEVIVRRLYNAQKITKLDYENYLIHKEQYKSEITPSAESAPIPRNYRHREPMNIFGKPYVGVVLNALHEKHITLNKASNYLDRLKISDIYKLEKHLVSS